jgi:hypothetical protein
MKCDVLLAVNMLVITCKSTQRHKPKDQIFTAIKTSNYLLYTMMIVVTLTPPLLTSLHTLNRLLRSHMKAADMFISLLWPLSYHSHTFYVGAPHITAALTALPRIMAMTSSHPCLASRRRVLVSAGDLLLIMLWTISMRAHCTWYFYLILRDSFWSVSYIHSHLTELCYPFCSITTSQNNDEQSPKHIKPLHTSHQAIP